MDDYARAHYELKFQLAFLEKEGDAFQDFFSSIMGKRYPGDFMQVRPWGNVGDQKCDGYLRTKKMLFQCYAPNDMEAAKCIAKIHEDFAGALPYWKDHFAHWVFVHNSARGLGPAVTKVLLDLGSAHVPLTVTTWGFEELRQEAMALDEPALASLFGPCPTRKHMIELGLAELVPVLDQVARLAPSPDPDLRPVPTDKLQRNLLSPAVETLLRAGMSRADLVRKYFKLEPTLRDRIAASFRFRYDALRTEGIAPDEVFAGLQRFASGEILPRPSAQAAVLAVLSFFFEECDIFERPSSAEERS
jgi:hypothetical protein